jgi:TonB family protein
VAPLRLSVERALIPAVILASAISAHATAREPFRYCSNVEREKYGALKPADFQPVDMAMPVYRHKHNAEQEGFVRVLIALRENGRVRDVCVLESAPRNFFEQPTVDAVRQWRYAPANVARLPKHRRLTFVIEYQLRDR